MSDRRDNRFNRKETSIHVPPYCISVVRHVKSVVHRHSTLSPRVIAKVPPPRVPAFSRSTTWVFRASWKMVLLVIPYAHHIWHYSCIRLNKFVPLVPDVGLFAKNTEGRFTVSLIVLTKAINSQGDWHANSPYRVDTFSSRQVRRTHNLIVLCYITPNSFVWLTIKCMKVREEN